MNNLVFCIECQEMTHMECDPLCGHLKYTHVRDERDEPMGVDVDFCDYPLGYAFVAPPEIDPDWPNHVQEPWDEETLIIDVQAIPFIEELAYFDPELPEEAVYLLK